MQTKTIAERETGRRTIAGTEFPVVNRVERRVYGSGRPEWVVTFGLCNGVPSHAVTYETRGDALAAFGPFELSKRP